MRSQRQRRQSVPASCIAPRAVNSVMLMTAQVMCSVRIVA